MFPPRPLNERWPAYVLGFIALFVVGYIGLQKSQPAPAPITITPLPAGPPTPAASKSVVVHVVGAVKSPQLLHLGPDSRVDDAIKAAGGPTDKSDLEAINLAAKLTDGTQLFVPTKGAKLDQVVEAYRAGATADQPYRATPTHAATHSGGKKAPSGPVSPNTGSLEQLQTIPGVGPSTAQSIVEYRQEHGGFARIEEIAEIRGIGPKKFEKMKKWLRL